MAWEYDILQEIAKRNVCADCHGDFTVAWWQGKYQLRCACGYHEEPGALERVKGNYEKVRTGEPVDDIVARNIRRVMRQDREMRELKEELRKEGVGK